MSKKKFSIHDAQIITTQDGYVFDSFIITELNGELVEFDRRRELEQALTLALQSEKLSALSITPNRQLQHFTVQTDVRFYENKKEHTEMELVALDKAGLLAQVSQIFSELNLNLLNAKLPQWARKPRIFFYFDEPIWAALDSQQREILRNVLYRNIG